MQMTRFAWPDTGTPSLPSGVQADVNTAGTAIRNNPTEVLTLEELRELVILALPDKSGQVFILSAVEGQRRIIQVDLNHNWNLMLTVVGDVPQNPPDVAPAHPQCVVVVGDIFRSYHKDQQKQLATYNHVRNVANFGRAQGGAQGGYQIVQQGDRSAPHGAFNWMC